MCDDKHLKLILPHHWSCKSQTAPLLWEDQHGLNMDQVFSRSQYDKSLNSLSVMSTPQPWVTSNNVQDYSVYTVPCASALKQHVRNSGRGWINSQHWLVGSITFQKGRATILCILNWIFKFKYCLQFVTTNNIYNSITRSQNYDTHHAQTYYNTYKGKVTLATVLVQKDELSIALRFINDSSVSGQFQTKQLFYYYN